MRLPSRSTLYARVLERDPVHDGTFFTGVLTTGIYCLPSCRARHPKAENVRFFATTEAAREAGLRACKQCHPDDYAAGADPVLEMVERAVGELAEDPARFADGAALVARLGYGPTRAAELCRLHYHATPAELVTRARLRALSARLHAQPNESIAAAAEAVGYASLSVAHEHCRTRLGMTPAAWRSLGNPALRRFVVELPKGFPRARLLDQLGRDPTSSSERRDGETFVCGMWLEAIPVRLSLVFDEDAVRVEIDPGQRTARPLAAAAFRAVAALTGLGADVASFVRHVSKLGHRTLVRGRETWGGSGTPDPWDALAWAILGQQINLSFAFRLRRTLAELAGTPVGEGLVAPPPAAAVATIDPARLAERQFSQAKSRTLLAAARRVADGSLDLAALAEGSATRAQRALLALDGIGPWTANYVMMRGLGFKDCVPYGDTGVTSALQRLFRLTERPDAPATRRLLQPFSPWRSLATFHLWQLEQ
jgi:AraC family transcriptional regulator, regulatory protein of adaptative response / DNA-3-methyladenine glycosylase II